MGLLSSVSLAQTVARVVSVEGSTFTLEVFEGGVSDTEQLELWSPAGKRAVTMSVPGSGYVERGLRSGVSCSGAAPAPRAVLTKKGQVASWAAAQAAVAAFPPSALVRVLSVEGGSVTIECLAGALSNGMLLDALSASGATPVTVTLPAGLDLVLKGDRVKGVIVAGGRVEPGALIGDRARFSSARDAAPFVGASPAPAAAAPAPPAVKENPAACVFTPAELQAALGFRVSAGKGTEMPFAGGTSRSCAWAEEKGPRSVTVNQIVMTTGAPATNAESQRKMLAGRLELIPNDADGAGWQVAQGDLTDVTLHYWRANTGTEVRVGGVDQKNAAAVAAMRKNVLKLPRR